MQIKDIREATGLSRAEFSRTYGIPVRTLENWETGIRRCQDYIINLLQRVTQEDVNNTDLSCYDPDMLKELGYLYNAMVDLLGGHNPYPCADVFRSNILPCSTKMLFLLECQIG